MGTDGAGHRYWHQQEKVVKLTVKQREKHVRPSEGRCSERPGGFLIGGTFYIRTPQDFLHKHHSGLAIATPLFSPQTHPTSLVSSTLGCITLDGCVLHTKQETSKRAGRHVGYVWSY